MSTAKRPPLPVDSVLPDLVTALAARSAVVLHAATGAGKTTRVPPALLDALPSAEDRILVLQPRRIAARATAARIAEESDWELGVQVGYHVRFDRRSGKRTRIEVVTEGILLQRLLRDPFLDGVAVVVFDEFHERNLSSDLALGMIRQVQETVRPELKIVVMSATLDPRPIAAYLGQCPVFRSDVRRFPVDVTYTNPSQRRSIAHSAADGVRRVLGQTFGDVLTFLPGLREIRQTTRLLEATADTRDLRILPLYGDLPAEEQDAVLRPCGTRRVILATNVAETSLTLEGVSAVVDSGWARQSQFDARVGLDRLRLVPISQASADQRAGRAGRTGPGICLRLWDERTHRARPLRDQAEIYRVDMAAAVLRLLGWVEPDLDAFPWFSRPHAKSLTRARDLLRMLGAMDRTGITALGRRLAALPLHPRLGRLLLDGVRHGCASEAALAAALLSERTPFARSVTEAAGSCHRPPASESDLGDRVSALEHFERTGDSRTPLGRLRVGPARWILRARDGLLRQIRRPRNKPADADADRERNSRPPQEALQRALLAAFPDRLAKRREAASSKGLMVGGRGVRLSRESGVVSGELLLCLEIDRGQSEALVRCASTVRREWLPDRQLRRETTLFFDAASERVCARRRVLWQDLLLEQSPAAIEDPTRAAGVLAEAAREHWPRVFATLPANVHAFVVRIRCLHEWLPELELPALDDAGLQAMLPSLCAGRRSFEELRHAAWLPALQQRIGYALLPVLEREAPQRIALPGGGTAALRYEEGKPPVLAARIQELFGLTETPRVARGRVPVLVHLLAPNMRPQQITNDLPSFWKNTYPEVRKQLRGRYPKHAWPEDPNP